MGTPPYTERSKNPGNTRKIPPHTEQRKPINMAGQRNLNDGDFKDILRRIKTLETAAPMNNAAIGRGGIEVYDQGVLNISDGTLLVNGLASITGTFRVSGGSTFTGTLNISGPLTVTGPTRLNGQTDIGGNTSVTGDLDVKGPLDVTGETKLNGKTDIGGNTMVTGDLDVKGPLTVTGATKLNGKTDIGGNTSVTGDLDLKGPLDVAGTMDIMGKSTLQNDLTVQAGGKVKVGGMTLDPTVASGAMTFSNGAQMFTNGDSIQMFRGEGAAQVTGTRSALSWGGASFSVDAGGRRVSNLPRTTEKPNLYVDGNGYLYRSTEA